MCEVRRLGNIYGFTGGNYAGNVYDLNGICPALITMSGGNRQPMITEWVVVKQATKEGYVPCKIGGVADLRYPTSKTRRGRVQDNGDVSPTLMAAEASIYKIESEYRIRKLTPKECWRLMGFTDEEFTKAEAVNSNTQLYKQAGNSIVVDVLVGIFSQLFKGEQISIWDII